MGKQVEKPMKKPTAKKAGEVAPVAKKKMEETSSTSKKKPPVVQAPPESPPSEQDGEEEAETEESSEEEEEEEPIPNNSGSAPVVAAAASVVQDSSSESESEAPPAPKRVKCDSVTETEKKKLFERLWTEEEEISLLQGILKFKSETDYRALYKTLKESNFLEDKSLNQFSGKIGSLKKKYGKENKTFQKAHDLKCFELCKKIWETSLVVKSKDKRIDFDWLERSNLIRFLTCDGVGESDVKEKWSKVSVGKKKKIEEKWKKYQEVSVQGVKLRNELVSVLSSAIFNN